MLKKNKNNTNIVYFLVVTALTHILNLIRERRLRPMMSWSNRFRGRDSSNQSRYFRELKKQIRGLLNLISGNNIVQMITGLIFVSIII